jgi:hypothetical protein
MADAPSTGDVLITTEWGRHLLSIVPYPHRLTLSDYELALSIAKKWAETNRVHVWRAVDGTVTKLPLD